MKSVKMWIVTGKVWKTEGGNRWVKYEKRTVLVTAESFADAYDVALEALMYNWSSQPCESEIVSLRPFSALGDGDHTKVIVPDLQEDPA